MYACSRLTFSQMCAVVIGLHTSRSIGCVYMECVQMRAYLFDRGEIL